MDQARAVVLLGEHFQLPVTESQGMNQGSGEIPVGRVNHHSGFLVDNQQCIILVNHIERNIFGYQFILFPGIGEHDNDHIRGLDLVVGLDLPVVDKNTAGIGSRLYLGAGSVMKAVKKEFVDPQERLACIGNKTEMLEKF